MKKVLHLASWYPNKTSIQEGDFIQRHLQAVSLYQPVQVIFVVKDLKNIKRGKKIETNINGNLKETIIYYRPFQTGISVADKIISTITYLQIYKTEIKNYINENGKPDLIHVHVAMRAGLAAFNAKKKYGIPFIISEHSTAYTSGSHNEFNKQKNYFRKTVTKIFNNAIAVTDVSFADSLLLKKFFNLNHIHIIRNVVNTNLFFKANKKSEKFRFIHVSSLGFQKNAQGIFNAFNKLCRQNKECELIVAGPLNNAEENFINESKKNKQIIFLGEIDYPEVAIQMQNASALLMFSRYENFPCVIIEALCCGLPVIATSVGGISEAVDLENGILVESENEEQLLNAMQKMINNYLKYDSEKIAETAKALYNYEKTGKQFADLYKKIFMEI